MIKITLSYAVLLSLCSVSTALLQHLFIGTKGYLEPLNLGRFETAAYVDLFKPCNKPLECLKKPPNL